MSQARPKALARVSERIQESCLWACGLETPLSPQIHDSRRQAARLHVQMLERRTPTSTTSGSQSRSCAQYAQASLCPGRPFALTSCHPPSPTASPPPGSAASRLRRACNRRWQGSPSVADGGAHHRWPSSVRGGTPKAIGDCRSVVIAQAVEASTARRQ